MAGGIHGRGHAWQGHACQRACMAGACMACTHPWQILRDTVNERAVRILLDCILVYICIVGISNQRDFFSVKENISKVISARQ